MTVLGDLVRPLISKAAFWARMYQSGKGYDSVLVYGMVPYHTACCVLSAGLADKTDGAFQGVALILSSRGRTLVTDQTTTFFNVVLLRIRHQPPLTIKKDLLC